MARGRAKKRKPKSAAKPSRRRPPRRTAGGESDTALAAFAHDIRTALTGILALGELLASSNLGERERRWAAAIKTSAEHLAALTTLAIDAAKIDTKTDAGALTLQQRPFRPRRLIEGLAESLAARAETKGLVRLEARATSAARRRAKLQITVTDSGIGLSGAEIKRLFRPFAQANTEIARRYGGAGLGLAMVKALAKLMGGDLAVASKPGRGSAFRLSVMLPLAAADTEGRLPAQQPVAPARRLAVLCAEDNPYGRVILNTILTELGHRADFVGSGEEVVEAVKRGYDVVLMDVTLPGIDGLEASRRIRALPDAAGRTPIVGISGRSEDGDEAAARGAGMNAYLRKPLSPSGLSEAIAAVIPPPA